jgi:hypothetical protein
MRDRAVILGGLALFLAAVTWPAWRTLASTPSPPPDLPRPTGATRCVAPAAYMRSSHMTLLVEWRDRVVRDGVRSYVDGDGRAVRVRIGSEADMGLPPRFHAGRLQHHR